MATRRDQLQSYQFLMQRVTSALVIHETDPSRSPFRRFAGAVFAGLMIAVIATAGVTVYGLFVQGGKTSWRAGEAIVTEKETGARYIYRDGTLYPVANYASARLLGAHVPVSASRNSLAGTPRGTTLGITGAPDLVPRAQDLLRGGWTLCASPDSDAGGARTARTVLLVGRTPAEGQPLGSAAILVTAVDDAERRIHLIWHNRRFEIQDSAMVLKALAWEALVPVPVRLGWLNGLAAGQPIGRIAVPDAVSAFRGVPSGQLYYVRNAAGNTQFYLALPDGLAKVTPMQADILRGDPVANPQGSAPQEIQAGQVVESQGTIVAGGDAQPPTATPRVVTPHSAQAPLCAVFPPDAQDPTVLTDAAVPAGSPVADTGGAETGGGSVADRVLVPPGLGALVYALPSAEATTGTLLLVTEPGRAYPVEPQVAMDRLGLPLAAAVRLPTSLVNRVPLGPALDPAAAGLPVTGS
ncbi:MAG: type VII secretion protein EccB [Dactylosporangium sp.]|nr:type VII secretion protein EccB [Dactylosporangium sp.]NNJ59822.1 type VII secretion protein EccB [Dactylosporangium sp.]